MGVVGMYGCGCKEAYRFPHITYPYSSCICSFLQQHPYFLFIFLMFFVLFIGSYVQDLKLKLTCMFSVFQHAYIHRVCFLISL